MEEPLKIKRLREYKFTEKRNPYKKYLNAKWNWTDIFIEIETSNETMKTISKKYNINYVTLRQKYSLFKNNKIDNVNNENRGGSNKKISEREEKELYDYIKENYIDTESVLNNNIIKEIVKEKFKNNDVDVSKWWITNFKKRWNLSTQKVKPSKVATFLPEEKDINLFLEECDEHKKITKTKFFSIMMKQAIIL